MDKKHDQHLLKIMTDFVRLASDKYQKGQAEHGGSLWEKKGLIDMAIDEAIDQVIYLFTLKQQIENKTLYKVNKKDN